MWRRAPRRLRASGADLSTRTVFASGGHRFCADEVLGIHDLIELKAATTGGNLPYHWIQVDVGGGLTWSRPGNKTDTSWDVTQWLTFSHSVLIDNKASGNPNGSYRFAWRNP